jgi:hypothetical protein
MGPADRPSADAADLGLSSATPEPDRARSPHPVTGNGGVTIAQAAGMEADRGPRGAPAGAVAQRHPVTRTPAARSRASCRNAG